MLTGHLLKDPDYVYRYHTGELRAPDGHQLESTFGNQPVVMPNDAARIAEVPGRDSGKSLEQRREPSPAAKA